MLFKAQAMHPELHPPIEWLTEESQSGFECPEAEQSGDGIQLGRWCKKEWHCQVIIPDRRNPTFHRNHPLNPRFYCNQIEPESYQTIFLGHFPKVFTPRFPVLQTHTVQLHGDVDVRPGNGKFRPIGRSSKWMVYNGKSRKMDENSGYPHGLETSVYHDPFVEYVLVRKKTNKHAPLQGQIR